MDTFFESPADHDKNVSTTMVCILLEPTPPRNMTIQTTQVTSSTANDPVMPPPKKVLRRGSRELEMAIGRGEVCLSLPQQNWNSWIVKDESTLDEEYFDSLYETNNTNSCHCTRSASTAPQAQMIVNVTPSPTATTTPPGGACSIHDPPPLEDHDTHKPTIETPNVHDHNQLESDCKLPRFSDIIGHNAVKIRIEEVLLPLALPSALADSILVGVRALPASILLFGPPGCGKTQLAKAIAGEADAAFLSAGPSDILSKFVGESEASIRSFFERAYDQALLVESKCAVLFFDEIDALGQARGGAHQQQDPCSRRVLAELLIQLNGLNSNHGSLHESIRNHNHFKSESMSDVQSTSDNDPQESGRDFKAGPGDHVRVIVVAATNRPEDCDPALLRRFSVRILVDLPSRKDRIKILQRFLTNIHHTITPEQFNTLSLETEGWTGSDLESLTREAVMAPVREGIRSAALLKRRNSMSQNGGISTDQKSHNDGRSTRDLYREKILEQFANLRPVSAQDFEDAIAFWAYNHDTKDPSNELSVDSNMNSFYHQNIHYDSSSDEEEAEKELPAPGKRD